MATKNKKMAQADSIGDSVVLKKLEEILGCGPGEDVLVRAENLQRELRIARADIKTKDVSGQNLMEEMKEARKILLVGRQDNSATLTELCGEMVRSFHNELQNMRNSLELPSGTGWLEIATEAKRVRVLVNEYGDLKQKYDALVAEKRDVEGELRRTQDASATALADLATARAEYYEQTMRLNSQIETVFRLEGEAKSVRFILTGENQGADSLMEIANQAMRDTADLRRQIDELRGELNEERHNLTEFGRAVLRGEITVIFPAPQ